VRDIAPQIAQCFLHDEHVESIIITPDNPVNIVELNGNIPDKDRDVGLDGKLRDPWQIAAAVYFLDEITGEQFTMINSTWGFRRAVEDLIDSVMNVRMMRGARVVPVVRIGAEVMKTRFGQKMRPSFVIKGWKGPAADQPLLKSVAPPARAEIVNGEIPDHPANHIATTARGN